MDDGWVQWVGLAASDNRDERLLVVSSITIHFSRQTLASPCSSCDFEASRKIACRLCLDSRVATGKHVRRAGRFVRRWELRLSRACFLPPNLVEQLIESKDEKDGKCGIWGHGSSASCNSRQKLPSQLKISTIAPYMYMSAYIINQLTFIYVPKVMYSCTSNRSPGPKIR